MSAIRGTIAGKFRQFGGYIKERVSIIAEDYRRSSVEMFNDMYEHKFRTAAMISVAGTVTYFAKINPTEGDYNRAVVTYSNIICTLPHTMRNKQSEAYVTELNRLRQLHLLDHYNLGVFSLVFQKVVPDNVMRYEIEMQRRTWTYSLLTLVPRFVDVGFAGHWRNFDLKMADYDLPE